MDKRISKRIPVSLEAHATWSGITYRAFITGISENGLYIIAPSGEKEFSGRDKTAVKVQFQSSPDHMIEVHCREIWADNDAAAHSTLTIGLEIQNPSGEFKEFYRASFFRIKKEMSHDAIAVVGMACYYPDAPDLKSFWENILARRRAFRRIPDQRLPLSEYYDADPFAPDKTYANRAAVIDGFEFDWVRRGIPKSVVDSSDIAHWLALEVALRAMEDAGYRKGNTPSDRSGVILGNTLTGEHSRSQNMRLRWPYVKKTLMAAAKKKRLSADVIEDLIAAMEVYYKSAFAPITEDTLAGNLSNTIAGRICNFLDLHGGGYTVDGACSSSLIALTTAANALSTGSLDLAVVGGVDISLDTFELVGFAKTNALTQKDMMVYDRHASGFIPGEGAGFVILKRLQSARAHGNYIYAVMRGWGMSSDGKGGMTAPKAQTQALAIRRAYGKAGYDLSETDFIEGHGTGTVVGDKAELEGIAAAMDYEGTSSLRSCGITSLKSLIGHTKAASGIGGFIKTVMAVNRRVIPPTAGFQEPNPVFQEKARQIYAITQGEVRDKSDIIRAGVSGMGFGGINVHVTIESGGEPAKHIAPEIGERELLVSSQDTELFVLSAASRQEMIERLTHLKLVVAGISTAEMTDLSRHLAKDMSHLKPLRLSLVAGTPENLIKCLDHTDQMLSAGPIPEGGILSNPQKDIWIGNSVLRNRVGFLFPGQGSQQLNMGRRLVERYSWARNFLCEAESWLVES
ncbi:MAG TPA: beta-ketoacyl synthase N-terminal-like domain-containing protein, partial [Dissulfurispiraceae bacterium]|nr:beta-ketoacyl synthase N-terminal-like domain-containing protein [Dissulfurispiraceae bacterium]